MRHHPLPPRAFTLVELLVVIAIIGVLMGLLLPAVQSAREAARRATCTNNQYQMANAATRFNDTNGFLPGWRNQVPQTTLQPSWPVMILPFMERTDIYKSWQGGTPAAPYVSFFVCPTSPPETTTFPTLAYAGNCGTGVSSVVMKSNGVMVDNVSPGTATVRLDLDEISSEDGTAMTLLFSEKCSTAIGLNQNWWDTRPTPTVSGSTSSFSYANPNGSYTVPSTIVPGFGIVGSGSTTRIITNPSLTAPGQLSQPSSNHPGGAVVAFCDGHTGFLKDSIPQTVYGRLITSDGIAASALGTSVNPVGASLPWMGASPPSPLSEGDFQ